MRFEDAATLAESLPRPRIPAKRAKSLYQHIIATRPERVLELGTARGGSALYIAAALESNNFGTLVSVDSRRWRWEGPNAEETLERAGLLSRVTFNREFATYTWYLKEEIERSIAQIGTIEPLYDLVFIDGAKNWTVDGLAFLLTEKLLKSGGWILFDDLGWTYDKDVKGEVHYDVVISALSDSEKTQPHITKVYDILVRHCGDFDQFVVEDDWWAWARKRVR